MSEVNAIPLHKVVNFSVKAKLLKIKSEGVVGFRLAPGLLILISLIVVYPSFGQTEKPVNAIQGTLPVKLDTIPAITPPDSSMVAGDTLKITADSLRNKKKGDIETTIFYSARDSLNSSIDRKIVKLYGDAKIKYGTIELEADEIVIDYEKSTISANAGVDSLGNQQGFPIFKNGAETYETRDMVYNFKTRRAKISEVRTKQNDGILHGQTVFKNEKNELYSVNNGYTTCDLAHPHYRIVSTRIKAIPGDKMVSGPFYMEFMDVPVPLGFLFGIFPSQRKSSSGIIVPTYGEERVRGFFLRNGGYFFDFNDYIKAALTFDLYSRGSNAIYVNSSYKKRYAYTGSISFNFTNNHITDQIESPKISKDFRLSWSHSPQTRGTGRFSASVTAATSSYTSNNYLGIQANTSATSQLNNGTSKLSSNVSYSKSFPNTPFSMGINIRHNQDITTKRLDLSLPDVTFNVNNLYPFKKVKGSLFLQNLSTRLTSSATNQITNDLGNIGVNNKDSIAPFNGSTFSTLLGNAKRGIKFNIPISTSIKAMKFFTITPNISFDETWYFQKLVWGVAPSGNSFVVTDTIKGFNTITNYSGSVGLTTRIYGTKFFKRGKIQAIRHIINPSISLSFQPDFGAAKYDYFQRFDLIDSKGRHTTTYKSRHEGFVYGTSRQGKSNSISFGINNNIEMKVKGKNDTIAKKIPLFNTLSISSSYNFAATSFRLSPINIAANTNILDNKINVSMSGVIDPYKYSLDSLTEKGAVRTLYQHKTERLAWQDGFSIGSLSSLTFAFSTNLNPKGQKKDNVARDKIGKSTLSDGDKEYLIANPDAYVDFSIPWNLRLNYNLSYAKTGFQPSSITQGVRFSGDVSLSSKWKVVFSSGYDFKTKQFTQTLFSLNRELHCWQMTVSWVPFGRFQNYSFTIAVRSAMLRDLKLDRKRSFQDNL